MRPQVLNKCFLAIKGYAHISVIVTRKSESMTSGRSSSCLFAVCVLAYVRLVRFCDLAC